MRPHPWLVVVLVGAAIGLLFAGVSTYDFVQHLDRQVHTLHCSFVPGLNDHGGASGCQVAMMSSYSSVFRGRIWGGIPIALPAMAVFAFILFFSIDLLVTRRKDDPRATALLVAAAAVPAVTSVVMAAISLGKLGTTCKLCVAIYVASTACIVGAIGLWRRAVGLRGTPPEPLEERGRRGDDPAWVSASKEPEPAPEPRLLEVEVDAPAASNGFLAGACAIGIAFVAVPIGLYIAMAPDHGRFVGTCGGLVHPDDTYGVMVRIEPAVNDGVSALEILDPLCPACKAFEDRLEGASGSERLDRKAILFPLDNTCNWMVTEATHPGACTVSEAVLCAGARSPEVIRWAFEQQDRIRAAAKSDPTAAARIVGERFPELASCVGSPEAKSRLNKSLRWAVTNNIHVLTPQLFIDGVKLCDEDVDLGLDYSLGIMLDRHDAGTLVVPGAVAPHPAEAVPAPTQRPAGTGSDKPAEPAAGTGSDKPAEPATGTGSDKPAEPAGAGTGSDKPAEPAAGTGSDKPAEPAGAGTGSDKPAEPAGAGTGSDKPAEPAAGSDKPAEPAAGGTDKPRKPPVVKHHKPAGDKPDKPADGPADSPADTPSDTPAAKPAKPSDKPADSPAETPSGGTS